MESQSASGPASQGFRLGAPLCERANSWSLVVSLMREPAVSALLLLSKTGIRGADSSDAEQAEALLARYRGDSTWTPTLMMISCSNWAKDKRMFSVRRPMDVVVLNCCVTETKLTPF